MYIKGMIPLYIPARNRFIKDVSSPTVGDAIKKSARHKKVTIPVKNGSLPANRLGLNVNGKITRIPPMAELHYYRPPRQVPPPKRILPTLPWLPKKYVAAKGLVTDWHTRTFREAKLAAPILVSSAALMLLALSWQLPEIKDYSNGHPQYVHNVSAAATSTDNPTSSDASSSKATAKAQPASPSSQLPAVQPSQASGPIITEPVLPTITPPIDDVIPPIDPGMGGGSGDTDPPAGIELPPVDIDLGPVQATTPGINLDL